MRFPQLLCAVVATHLNSLSADFDFDSIRIQPAVASRACSRFHDTARYF